VRARRLDMLKLLIQHGANVKKESDALYCAVDTGQLDVVKFLVEQGSPVSNLALLRARDHQQEILAYLTEIQAKGSPKPARAPERERDQPVSGVPFSVPTRPLDAAVVVASQPEIAGVAAAYLHALGYPTERTVMLTGTSATRAGLAKELEGRLPKVVSANSTVFFYFAGNAVVDGNTQYLLASDGDGAFPQQTGYALGNVLEKLGALGARLTVLAVDAPVTLEGLPQPNPYFYAVSASTSAPANGLFSRLFFDGLGGAAKGPNDVVTLGSLADFIGARSAQPTALPNRRRLAEVVLH
jgi:hypothetical protein